MKRPSFQFYPADWQANSNLRRCTHEEKGIWIDVMCLLHDQEEYGIVRWSLKEIAQAIGCTTQKVRGLVSKGVLKGADVGEDCQPQIYIPRSGRREGAPVTLIPQQAGPIWFSSRMVEDEYKRVLRGEHGASPKPTPNPSPKPPIGEGIDEAPKPTPNPSPDPSPFTRAPVQAPRAAPSSSSSSSSKPCLQPASTTQLESGASGSDGALATPAELSGVMHKAGIQSSPGDPRLIALAAQGVGADTVAAACEEARKAKPGERIPPGYVIGIVERWAGDAARINATGASAPHRSQSHDRNAHIAATVAAFTGSGRRTESKVIDGTAERVA